MPRVTHPLALFHSRFCLQNGAKSNRRTLGRCFEPSYRYLFTGKSPAKMTETKDRMNSTSSQTRTYLSSTLKCFRWYFRQQQRRPYVTELCTMAVIYSLGDLSAQMNSVDDYDVHRTMRSITIGIVAAIPSRKWFLLLGRNFNYSSKIASTTTKVVLNQLIYTPLFIVYFFAFHAILAAQGINGAIERVKHTVPKSLPRSFLYWPLVTALNFTYVPPQSRSVVTGIFAVVWQSYLSLLNAQAQKYEKGNASAILLPQS